MVSRGALVDLKQALATSSYSREQMRTFGQDELAAACTKPRSCEARLEFLQDISFFELFPCTTETTTITHCQRHQNSLAFNQLGCLNEQVLEKQRNTKLCKKYENTTRNMVKLTENNK